MAITEWHLSERPREKLLLNGAGVLSDAELLAIFIRTGVRGKTAVDLARELLQVYGSLRKLLMADQTQFCSNLGMGEAKYAQLQAALEIGKRYLHESLVEGDQFSSADDTKRYLSLKLRGFDHEVFSILFLDNQHRLIAYEEMFHGTIDESSVYPREVVKRALFHNAAAVIFAHNHPSGCAEPSRSDRQITLRLSDALALMDIRVLDHIIVGNADPVSFAERGLLGLS